MPSRIVAKVEHHVGQLFPRVGFIVTNLPLSNRAVVRFYNKRGTAEHWIKEGKQAAHWTRLSCHRFRANEARLQLSVLAFNLGSLWRRLVLPKRIDTWSLTSLQQRLVKTGGRLVKHARYYWLFLAERHLTRRLLAAMLQRIWALPVPTGSRTMAAGDRLGRRRGATRESCRRTVGGGRFGGPNSGPRGGRHEVRPRRPDYSSRTERTGVGCGRSSEAESEMSVYMKRYLDGARAATGAD